ncbi:ABC transporter ATP-binding protein [Xanthobacter autotrophicus DSM 431]|uniref:ABC transporter ATP-binding protein n=1 Tax=Xanthobacter nonsaccharivorans TaxID=3119912 RepID=UPI003728381A
MTAPAPTAAPAAPTVHLSGVSRSFGDRRVLEDIRLDVAAGEFVVIVGASGCGKSTLLRLVAGLDREAEGTLEVTDSRAIVFQDPRLLPWKKVWRNIVLGLDGPSEQLRALARATLAEVGLTARADAWPLTLSGGEAQRVGLARALVRTPELLLLDEPFAALDALTRLKMQRLVLDLWRRHRISMLFVTHDVEEALLLADRVVLIDHGRIARQIEVDLPRPRDRRHPVFGALETELLAALGVAPEEPAPPQATPHAVPALAAG